MNQFLIISNIALWILLGAVAFLLLGALRSLGLLQWRLDELEATRPVRRGREGLPEGTLAPDFTLSAVGGGQISLSDFAGQQVLLVFTQSGCGPCHSITPELNRLHEKSEHLVLVVNNAPPDETAEWAAEVRARFSVVAQEDWEVSKKYRVFATPYAFAIDGKGAIAAKGVASTAQYLRYILGAAEDSISVTHKTPEREPSVDRESLALSSPSEVMHV